jgi:hypothetical protein
LNLKALKKSVGYTAGGKSTSLAVALGLLQLHIKKILHASMASAAYNP